MMMAMTAESNKSKNECYTGITKGFLSKISLVVLTVSLLLCSEILISLWSSTQEEEGRQYSASSRRLEEKDSTRFFHREGNVSIDWTPIDCPFLLENSFLSDPNNGRLYSRLSSTSKYPFWMCLHNFQFDRLRKVIFDTGNYYEKRLSQVFELILRESPPNARVIDVGGNIGWFTMLSASTGHHVDVFEPNLVNIIRQCQSMWLNGWTTASETDILNRRANNGTKRLESSVNIRPYAVGSNSTFLKMYVGINPGKATFYRDLLPRQRQVQEMANIPVVTLDSMALALGWFESQTPIAILKVDVEGFEPPVFIGAQRLLSSGLVQHVLMELTGRDDNSENIAMLQILVRTGYRLHQVGGTKGPDNKRIVPPYQDNVEILLPQKTGHQTNMWWVHKSLAPPRGE